MKHRDDLRAAILALMIALCAGVVLESRWQACALAARAPARSAEASAGGDNPHHRDRSQALSACAADASSNP